MIIILNGPCGVEKSMVAQLMAEQLDNTIYIKGDDVFNMIVNSEIIPEHIMLTERNMLSLIRSFVENGYKNYIIDFVYEEQYCLYRFVTELKKYVSDVFVIRLFCNLKENIRRDSKRKPEDICGRERVIELNKVFSNVDEKLGHVVDNILLSPNKTVEVIMEFVNNLNNKYQQKRLER